MDEDDNNFMLELTAPEHTIVMKEGKLEIDNVQYEEDPENPTYDLVREIYRLQNLVDNLSIES